MASDNDSYTRSKNDIFTPFGRISPVWIHFGYKKDSAGVLIKGTRAYCKLCCQTVAHGGGTTNLKNHLRLNHPSEYTNLFPGDENVDEKQHKIEDFARPTATVARLSASSHRAKLLTEAITDFIVKDMRPISTVDGEGFVNLMGIAEPHYNVPCRKTIMSFIDQRFLLTKTHIKSQLEKQSYLSLTTDMWTSRSGDGYISLTAHYITADFEMKHNNLTTCHLPGTHDHTNIAAALRNLAEQWVIDLDDQVTCFTTDNGSNIVKMLRDDLQKMHIPCAGHTLNLSVEAALKERSLTTALARCRKVVTHFHQSRLDREALRAKQKLLELPEHSLIQDVSTRWNSVHDMIKRACEQQPAIAAVLHRRRDLTHLELS